MLTNIEANELFRKIWKIIMKTYPSMIQQLDLAKELARTIYEFEEKEELE